MYFSSVTHPHTAADSFVELKCAVERTGGSDSEYRTIVGVSCTALSKSNIRIVDAIVSLEHSAQVR